MADNTARIIISAEDRTRQAFESAKNGLHGLEAAAARIPMIGAALAGAFSVTAIAGFVKEAISFTAALDDMAEKTGASVEVLSGLVRVAQIGGHDLGIVEDAAIKLAKGLAAADDKSSGAARALKALGLSAAQLRGMDTGDALKVVADRLAQYQDGAGKTALAIDLLGKSGAQALPYLKDLAEQGALVKTVTTEQAAAAEKFEKNINRLKVEMGDLTREIANKLLPAFNKFLEAMNRPGAGFGGAVGASIDRALFGGNIQERISKLQGDLATLQGLKTKPGSPTQGGIVGGMVDVQIQRLQQTIAGLKALQASDALANAASYSNEGRTGGMRSLAGYVSTNAPDKKNLAKTDLERFLELGRKNELEAYYATGGEETMREVAEKRILKSAQDEMQALERLRQKYVDLADPLQKYRDQLDEINRLRELGAAAGGLTDDQALEAMWRVNEAMDEHARKLDSVKEKTEEVKDAWDEFAREGARGIQSALADFLFDPFDKGMDGMVKKFGMTIQRMVADAVAADLAKKMFGSMGKTGDGGSGKDGDWGWIGSAFSWLKGAFGFEHGGVMTPMGPLPLQRYAFGGVATSPQLALFGEGTRPEAFVPLPDGRRIPVAMQGGGGMVINQTIYADASTDKSAVRRSAAEGARAVLSVIRTSARYG